MKYPSLKFLDKLNVATLPTEELAYYAYALICCQYPASVVSGELYQMVDEACSRKIAELRDELNHRLERDFKSDALNHALAVIDETVALLRMTERGLIPHSLRNCQMRNLLNYIR